MKCDKPVGQLAKRTRAVFFRGHLLSLLARDCSPSWLRVWVSSFGFDGWNCYGAQSRCDAVGPAGPRWTSALRVGGLRWGPPVDHMFPPLGRVLLWFGLDRVVLSIQGDG